MKIFNRSDDQAEKNRDGEEQLFEQIFMQSSVSTQILDKDGWCERINPKLSEAFGVKPEHIEGKVYNIFKDEALKKAGVLPQLKKVFHEGKSVEWEILFDIGLAAEAQNIEVKEKKKVWYHNWAFPIFDEKGTVAHVVIQHEDIASRKEDSEKLATTENRFKIIFDEAPLGIAVIDSLTGRFYSVNPMFAKIAGRTVEEMTQINWMSITHPDDIEEDLSNMARLNAGEIKEFQMEKRYIQGDGTVVWINMVVAPIFVDDKAYPRHLCMIEDITARKEKEEELNKTNSFMMNREVKMIELKKEIATLKEQIAQLKGETGE